MAQAIQSPAGEATAARAMTPAGCFAVGYTEPKELGSPRGSKREVERSLHQIGPQRPRTRLPSSRGTGPPLPNKVGCCLTAPWRAGLRPGKVAQRHQTCWTCAICCEGWRRGSGVGALRGAVGGPLHSVGRERAARVFKTTRLISVKRCSWIPGSSVMKRLSCRPLPFFRGFWFRGAASVSIVFSES